MNYLESIRYIESLSPTTVSPSLTRVASFLAEAGRPQDSYPVIHVGGTNGKGSTVAVIDCALRLSGLKVGRFTGPHLLQWNERFHVDGRAVDDECFAGLASRVRRMSESFAARHPDLGPLTWFEFLTAMAFIHFAECRVDAAVIEVGLGGRWDATNAIGTASASVITNVDLDHTQILGATVDAIAREKAGIIKPGVPVITCASGPALAVISQRAAASGCPFAWLSPPACLSTRQIDGDSGQALARLASVVASASWPFALSGAHQRENAIAAGAALHLSGLVAGLNIEDLLRRALEGVYWPGRMQYLASAGLLIDGAHNPAGAAALSRAIDDCFGQGPRTYVLACFENKNVEGMLASLIRPGDRLYAAEADTRRKAMPAGQIAAIAARLGATASAAPCLSACLEEALSARSRDGLVVATGSLATVRETMQFLGWRTVEDGRQDTALAAGLASLDLAFDL